MLPAAARRSRHGVTIVGTTTLAMSAWLVKRAPWAWRSSAAIEPSKRVPKISGRTADQSVVAASRRQSNSPVVRSKGCTSAKMPPLKYGVPR
jgi:hypothetical protein